MFGHRWAVQRRVLLRRAGSHRFDDGGVGRCLVWC